MIPRLHPDPRLSSLVWKTGDTYLPLDDPLYFPRTIRFEFYLFLSLSIVLSWEEGNFLKFVIARVYFFHYLITIPISDMSRREFFIIFIEFCSSKGKERDIKFWKSWANENCAPRYQFSARKKMAALSYPSRYLTPFWNSARAEINRERNVSRKIRDVTRTRSTAFPCFVFELEQGLCLWVILFRIERAMCNYNSLCWM